MDASGRWAGRAAGAALVGLLAFSPSAASAAQNAPTGAPGMARSSFDPGILWILGGNSAGASLAAVSRDGDTLGRYQLKAAGGRWEAVASARAPGKPAYLYLGDLGGERAEVVVHQAVEPSHLEDGVLRSTRFRFTYLDGPHHATALAADPRTGRLYVVTADGPQGAGVYAAPARPDPKAVGALTRVAAAPPDVTDAIFLPDGRLVLLTGEDVYVAGDPASVRSAQAMSLPAGPMALSIAVGDDTSETVLIGRQGTGGTISRLRLPAPAGSEPAVVTDDGRSRAVAWWASSGAGPRLTEGLHRWSFAYPAVAGVFLVGLVLPRARRRGAA